MVVRHAGVVRARARHDEHVLDEEEALPEVIERGDVTGQREDGVGVSQVVGRDVRQALDLPHDVVAEVTDEAAVEGREVGQGRGPVPGEKRFQRGEDPLVARQAGRGRTTGDLHLLTACDECESGIPSDEREPAPVLAVLDRLEQEALAVADELGERRHGGFEISEHLAPHRYDRVVARQRDELIACRAAHNLPGAAPLPNARKKQVCSPVWQAPRPSCSTTNSRVSMSQS